MTRGAFTLECEHMAMVRHWARLQHDMDALREQHRLEMEHLQARLLRLQAELVIRHTQTLWGLGYQRFALTDTPQVHATPDTDRVASATEVTRAAICQSGCISQAHAWLGEEQHCRLHGGRCEPLTTSLDTPCA